MRHRNIVHSVPTIAALPDRASEGSMVIVANYYPDIQGGGGAFCWKGGRNKREHNGGTIIDPTHSIRPGDAGYWRSEHTTNGVWVRCADGDITARQFGARGDGISDDTAAVQAAYGCFLFCVVFDSADALRDCANALDDGNVDMLRDQFAVHGHGLSLSPEVIVISRGKSWKIVDGDQQYGIWGDGEETLVVDPVTRRKLYLPPGTYKGNFVFNGEAPVIGAGIKRTVLMPFNESAACVLLYGDGRDPLHSECNWGAALSNLSIVGPRRPWDTLIRDDHVGLKCGSDPGSGFSNGLVEHVEISAFDINWDLRSAVMCSFRQVFSHFGGIGLRIDSERNVTTCHFDTCRFVMNGDGMVLRGGYALVFTTCNSESNRHWGLDLRTGISSGPARHIYNGCWFEENGWDGSGGAINLDMQPARALTKPMDVEFNRCVISSPGNSVDIHADRAQNVVFRECAFTSDGFGNSKFTFARDETSACGTVRIRLIQCGTLQERPTSAMYADFPPLITTDADPSILPTAGYEYEFWENGRLHTNRYPYGVNGSPQGVLQPSFVGEEVFDALNKAYYRATGLTEGDWVALN